MNLGFCVNRESLDKYINENTEYNSFLETSVAYAGANIKIPLVGPIDLDLSHITFRNGQWEMDTVPYSDYLDMLTPKERQKELNKERYNTFLVFYSGNCIVSGMHTKFMKEAYHHFLNILEECPDYIEAVNATY